MPTIIIASFDHALPSALTGIIDLFYLANLKFIQKTIHQDKPLDLTAMKVLTASQSGLPIIDGQGRTIEVDTDFNSVDKCDAILIPGFIPSSHGHPPRKSINQQTKLWLKRQHQQGALIGGSCSGTFVLGEAGLLNKLRCTTTWWLHDELRRRFPQANAAWASELIDDRGIITAGGPLSWVNIALHIVKELAGANTAKLMADFAVVDSVPKSQNLFVPQGYQLSKDSFLMTAEHHIRQAHYCPISTNDLASFLAVSQRTLHRKLKQLSGETPKGFIDPR